MSNSELRQPADVFLSKLRPRERVLSHGRLKIYVQYHPPASLPLSLIMDAGPSTPPGRSRVDIRLPANLLIMPFTAAFVGLLLGMSRGGRRERLRFLAENAHRAPRTVQGWVSPRDPLAYADDMLLHSSRNVHRVRARPETQYFYTKTRNYRVFFAAARTGARYALGLGAATTAFVLLEEGSGVMREQYLGRRALKSRRASERYSWRDGGVGWEDGAVAGGFMGAGVGLACEYDEAGSRPG